MENERGLIDQFKGINEFLSNFYPCPVEYEGIIYPTSEAAFQAAKTLDLDERKRIAALPRPAQAKAAGKKVKLRVGWNDIRVEVMREVVRLKFEQNPELAARLIATGDAELVEGNSWNDRFWGQCKGIGQNHLGKILMKLRTTLKEQESKSVEPTV